MENNIVKKLFELQDLQYRAFHSKLMPTVNPEKIIGIRVPELRKFAKDFSKAENSSEFMQNLPHKYYEEDNLHAFLIEQINSYEKTVEALNRFLPYIDNWATCDMLSPKIFARHRHELFNQIEIWLKSEHTYTIRFAMNMLMKFYLDENFKEECHERAASVSSEEYYVKMMQAWYFATALAKQWDKTVVYLEENRLGEWVHNKTIQKAVESFRVTPEQKEYLKKLKRKS